MANSKFRCPTCKQYSYIEDAYSNNGVNRYCSRACAYARSGLNQNKPPPARVASGSSMSRRAPIQSEPTPKTIAELYLRDAGRCRMCSTTRLLHTHHVAYRSEHTGPGGGADHSLINLILLCQKCHDTVHQDKKKWKPILLAYIWLVSVENQRLWIREVEVLTAGLSPAIDVD